jgi:hypothetical protein
VTDPALAQAEPLRFYRSVTVGPDFPSKLAAASLRYLLVSPVGFVRVIVIAIAFAIAVYYTAIQKNGPGYALTFAGLALLGFFVLMVVVAAIGFAVERRRMAERVPAGSEFAVGFRDRTILMRSPMDTAEVEFTKYVSFEESGDFVVLRQRSSRILNFLPAECFTTESLAYLREKIPLPANTRRKL